MRPTTAVLASAAAAIALSTLAPAQRARAVTLDLPLSATGQAVSFDQSTFFVTSPANPVYIDWRPGSSVVQERRGILEFNLAPLPAGALVRSAHLLVNVSQYDTRTIGTATVYPSLTFFSYPGNNAVDLADAGQMSNTLAITTINATGPFDIPLNLARVQSLTSAHPAALGILAYANSQDLTAGLWTAPSPPTIAAPTIELTYAPAGDANFDDRVNADDFALIDRGFAKHLTGWSNGDFNSDGTVNQSDYLIIDTAFGQAQGFSPGFLTQRESQFGADYVADLLTTIPEPTPSSILYPLSSLLFLLPRHRGAPENSRRAPAPNISC